MRASYRVEIVEHGKPGEEVVVKTLAGDEQEVAESRES